MDNEYYNDPENFPAEMPKELQEHIKSQSYKDQVSRFFHMEISSKDFSTRCVAIFFFKPIKKILTSLASQSKLFSHLMTSGINFLFFSTTIKSKSQ